MRDLRELAVELYMRADPSYTLHRHSARIAKLVAVLRRHPGARVEFCSDERTGHRYGRANCRIGRCRKLGSSSFPSRDPHQCWAVWA